MCTRVGSSRGGNDDADECATTLLLASRAGNDGVRGLGVQQLCLGGVEADALGWLVVDYHGFTAAAQG